MTAVFIATIVASDLLQKNSREWIDILDGGVIKEDDRFMFFKPANTHNYFHASSCHLYHTEYSIPCSQILCLNIICLENYFFFVRGVI